MASPTTPAASEPVTTAAATSTTTTAPSAFDVQGHRGARGLQPENTLPGFETALDLGVTTLELDLHFTGDGAVVVWHDPVITGDKCRLDPDATVAAPDPATAADRELAIAVLARDQLRAYRCDTNPDPGRFPEQSPTPTDLAGSNYAIVTLEELFEFVARYETDPTKSDAQRAAAAAVRFNVETKRVPDLPATIGDGFDGTNAGPFEEAILDAVAGFSLSDRVTIQSFDHRSLQAIRAVDPDISLAALTRRNEPFAASFVEFADIWSPDYRSLSAGALSQAQATGMLVIPWTVNEPADMERLIGLGVDGLITDRPDLLIASFAAGR